MTAAREMVGLREEIKRLRAALAYYARPRVYGTGIYSVFVDDGGIAATALDGMEKEG